jgi:NAD(P)-dependent dehydrogenase (short-subunit alcohol dehydrogenase family)
MMNELVELRHQDHGGQMNRRLENKVAIITGIAGGQGRAAAILFASEGCTVVGCDLRMEGARDGRDRQEGET